MQMKASEIISVIQNNKRRCQFRQRLLIMLFPSSAPPGNKQRFGYTNDVSCLMGSFEIDRAVVERRDSEQIG